MQSVVTQLASPKHVPAVEMFFTRFAAAIRESAVSDEMLCPSGIRAAVARREVLIGVAEETIVAAARIYRRRTREALSLYQFAVSESFRRQRLLLRLLSIVEPLVVEVICN